MLQLKFSRNQLSYIHLGGKMTFFLSMVALTSLFCVSFAQSIDEENINIDREVSQQEDIVEFNIEHGDGDIEGDIKLTQEEKERMNGDGNDRSLLVSNWPKTGSYVNIPYSKDGGQYHWNNPWTSSENANIRAAIDAFEENTCIRFVPRTTEEDYIHIISGSGCWSYVGMIGGYQELSLKANACLSQVGTAIHELMHAIGYKHEHSRSDRDQYIRINLDNVKPGKENDFILCQDCDSQGLPYDIGSIMHYHEFAFALDNSIPTIEALDGTSGDEIGQRSGFSPLDIEGINKVYCECAADSDCSGTETCNGGFCIWPCTGGNSCCTSTNKCGEDEGDCDNDSDCNKGLKCGKNNCSQKSGFQWDRVDDCCYRPDLSYTIRANTYCKWGAERGKTIGTTLSEAKNTCSVLPTCKMFYWDTWGKNYQSCPGETGIRSSKNGKILYIKKKCARPLPNADESLTCVDGTKCNPKIGGWSCCVAHGGRTNCPKSEPVMCSTPDKCGGGQDYCCAENADHCIAQEAGPPMCISDE